MYWRQLETFQTVGSAATAAKAFDGRAGGGNMCWGANWILFLTVGSVSTRPESGGNAKQCGKVRRTSRLLPARALQATRARLGLWW